MTTFAKKFFLKFKQNNYMATLGSKLLKLRHAHKFSQLQIAEKLDVSQNAYCQWESDKCKPNANNLQKIAVFYKVEISDLLYDKVLLLENEKFSKEIIEQILQNQANILRMLEMYLKQFDIIA